MRMKIYICTKCLFCFERAGPVESCPDCASMNIRAATEDEAAEYKRNRAKAGGVHDKAEK